MTVPLFVKRNKEKCVFFQPQREGTVRWQVSIALTIRQSAPIHPFWRLAAGLVPPATASASRDSDHQPPGTSGRLAERLAIGFEGPGKFYPALINWFLGKLCFLRLYQPLSSEVNVVQFGREWCGCYLTHEWLVSRMQPVDSHEYTTTNNSNSTQNCPPPKTKTNDQVAELHALKLQLPWMDSNWQQI